MTTIDEPQEEMAQLEIVKGDEAELQVGGLRFVACRREIDKFDGGVSLYVFSDLPDDDRELLRVDLFRERPHYHAPAENRAEFKIKPSADKDALDWGVEAFTTRASELVLEGGFNDIAEQLDQEALASCGTALREMFDGLGEPTEVSHFEVPRSVFDALEAG